MNKIIIIILLLLPNMVLALPTAKYTILVVDEQGVPIEGADTSISFMRPKSQGWGGKTNFISGKTDKGGIFTGQGVTERYGVYGADADGYYGTSFKYNGFTGVSGILGFRKWQPWNPSLEVVLKKIINPIPMYAYYSGMMAFPDVEGSIGYDLVKHDWVSPYGKGITADFVFKLEGEFRSMRDSNVKFLLEFSNATDGLQPLIAKKTQGSNFISDHHAPLTGYQPKLKQSRIIAPGKLSKTSYNNDDDYNYYFRIRCGDAKVNTCLYGKIYNRIEFAARRFLSFTYYLNPTPGDTNIEFDPKRNLFKDLKNKISAP